MYTNRTYILWRGRQRVHFREDDITADRISAVFSLSSVFLSYLHCQIISLNVAGLRWCCYLGIMILFKNRKGIGWSQKKGFGAWEIYAIQNLLVYGFLPYSLLITSE